MVGQRTGLGDGGMVRLGLGMGLVDGGMVMIEIEAGWGTGFGIWPGVDQGREMDEVRALRIIGISIE